MVVFTQQHYDIVRAFLRQRSVDRGWDAATIERTLPPDRLEDVPYNEANLYREVYARLAVLVQPSDLVKIESSTMFICGCCRMPWVALQDGLCVVCRSDRHPCPTFDHCPHWGPTFYPIALTVERSTS